MDSDALIRAAREVRELLRRKRIRLVLAESCTGGLVASTLARIPGVSEQLCGSFVVYRDESKARWLGVSRETLARDSAVSMAAVRAMACSALRRTPEADLSAAVTGFIGDGPGEGRVFIAVTTRGKSKIWVEELKLLARSSKSESAREKRQALASVSVFFMVRSVLMA